MAFLGQDDILVLENGNGKGILRRITNSSLLAEPLLSVDFTQSLQSFMYGIAIAKHNNPVYIFLYFTEWETGKEPGNRLYRYEWINNTLTRPQLLLYVPATPGYGVRHPGGDIEIGPDNNIYLVTGDDNGLHHTLAQNENGSSDIPVDGTSGVIRITQDGHPVAQNGILGDTYPLILYYAYGIRNSFGLDFDPLTGNLWDTENGPNYGDEINLIEPGFNSGSNKIHGFSSISDPMYVDELIDFGGKGKYSEPEFEWHQTVVLEPYSIQQTLAVNNYAFRDYFQGAIKTDDTYLGNVHTTAAASGVRTAKIAVPVYSLKNNSTIVGVWAGSMEFGILNKELQSLNLTSLDDNTRVIYVDGNGEKVADSDITKSTIPESFANLSSFQDATNGQAGSTIDTANNTKMLVAYQPVKAFNNTWAVLLMRPTPQ
jgi:Glucose / Sorbosone dehydrogenase